MSNAIHRLLGAVVVGGLLASCSMIENVLPPQEIQDPLGLHDVALTLTPPSTLAGIGAEATGTWSADLGPATVSDIDTEGIPDWFDPDGFRVDIGLRSTVTLSSTVATGSAAFSDAFELEHARLTGVSIEDGDGSPRVDLDAVETAGGATVSLRKADCTMPPVTCDYVAQSGLDAFVLSVVVRGAQMDQLYAILTGGAPTNRVRGTFELTATGTAPSDTVITVTLNAPSGTLDP